MTKKKWIILIILLVFSGLWAFLYFHPYDSSWTRTNKDGSCPEGYFRDCCRGVCKFPLDMIVPNRCLFQAGCYCVRGEEVTTRSNNIRIYLPKYKYQTEPSKLRDFLYQGTCATFYNYKTLGIN